MAYWSLLQETLWISTGVPLKKPSNGQSLFTKSKAAVKLHGTAMFHLSVADCTQFLINNRASALTRNYFNMTPMSGRQYLRRKHLGLLPLNPLWVRAGVLGCDSDHARKSNDGCLMTRMASPILTQLIYKPAAELALSASPPTNPLWMSQLPPFFCEG